MGIFLDWAPHCPVFIGDFYRGRCGMGVRTPTGRVLPCALDHRVTCPSAMMGIWERAEDEKGKWWGLGRGTTNERVIEMLTVFTVVQPVSCLLAVFIIIHPRRGWSREGVIIPADQAVPDWYGLGLCQAQPTSTRPQPVLSSTTGCAMLSDRLAARPRHGTQPIKQAVPDLVAWRASRVGLAWSPNKI
jgi:hypothetical protein